MRPFVINVLYRGVPLVINTVYCVTDVLDSYCDGFWL